MAYALTPHFPVAPPPLPVAAPTASPWTCLHCLAGLPTESLATRTIRGTVTLQCPHCAGQVQSNMPAPVRATFYEKLTTVALYPIQGFRADLVLFGASMLFFTEIAARFSLRALPLRPPFC